MKKCAIAGLIACGFPQACFIQQFFLVETELYDLLIQGSAPNAQRFGDIIHSAIMRLDGTRDQLAFKCCDRLAQSLRIRGLTNMS